MTYLPPQETPVTSLELPEPAHGLREPADLAPAAPMPAPAPVPKRRITPLILGGLVGAGIALGGVWVGNQNDQAAPVAPTIPRVVNQVVVSPESPAPTVASAVAGKVIPSVVQVKIVQGDTLIGSGSGVVLDADKGHIVTNHHVIDGAGQVQVELSDGRVYDATVLGSDSRTDLALLQIGARDLVAIEQGDSLSLKIGSLTVAVGNPLGLLGGPTVTVGVLSARDRFVGGSTEDDTLFGMLQTDAPIISGSSGGALVDASGRLIGITSAVGLSDVGPEGLGFAIPIEVVQRVTRELEESGQASAPFLGIEGRTAFEASDDGGEIPVGVEVNQLIGDSSAGASGVRQGDVIVSVDGSEVRTMERLVGMLRRYSAGTEIRLQIERSGSELDLSVVLGERVS